MNKTISNDINDYIDVSITGMVTVTAITDYEEKSGMTEKTYFLAIDDIETFKNKHPFTIKEKISICGCNPSLLKSFDYYEVEYKNNKDIDDIDEFICVSQGYLENWKGDKRK